MSYQDPPINPYDPNSQDFTPETKPLDKIISEAIESAFLMKNVWMPAKVVAVKGNQKVDIQILLQSRYMDGTIITPPPIQNVMVSMPMGADYSIKLPITVGDTGLAFFCDRSLDNWSVQGGIVDPQDNRNHDISDPVFVPGLYPFNEQTEDDTTDLVMTNGDAKARLQKTGKFVFTNGSEELLQILDDLLDTLINNTYTLTLIGAEPFVASTRLLLTEIRLRLDELKE